MYSPQYAIETDRAKIDKVIQDNSFATIVYSTDGKSEALHLPLVLVGNKLIGHMAKANPSWNLIHHKSVLVIFHGPHSYISPAWYGTDKNVPTWNYISVHIQGQVTINEDESFLREALRVLSNQYDSVFDIEENINSHVDLLKGIVGIEISIDQVFAKFKLAQSKPAIERENVIKKLRKSTSSVDHQLAEAMELTLKK